MPWKVQVSEKRCSTWTDSSCHHTENDCGSEWFSLGQPQNHRGRDPSVTEYERRHHSYHNTSILKLLKKFVRSGFPINWPPNSTIFEWCRLWIICNVIMRRNTAFCRTLSLVMRHDVTIFNRKASFRASSGNMRRHHLQRNQRPCTPVLVRLCSSFFTPRAHWISSSWYEEPPSMPSVIKLLYRTLDELSSGNAQACCPMTLFSCMIKPAHIRPMRRRWHCSSFGGKRWNIHRSVEME